VSGRETVEIWSAGSSSPVDDSSGLSHATSPDKTWLTGVPTPRDYSGVKQWFQEGGVVVGVDKHNSVVVYKTLRI